MKTCTHCGQTGTHYCYKVSRIVSEERDSGDFVMSAAIGYATNSAILGGLIGGDFIGGVVGDMLNGGLND